ncbi:nucleoside triphosphate pyrophosphohydrolase family protein [Pseudoxanthomonas kaohsiungensis]|uniref:Nucleoside triphosphate pyrophosphohydrolase family protein n=1 Tax=Pseudoxanthomonas kaohsiungensis TaxID=283923 RepID=A0ABW3LZS5_9GAMM|nr:nucleoside triphosphate pyrophosphohydrolase family protein [Pseudoxanthomonas kaohsiungensis]
MDAASSPPDLTLTAYSERAQKSQRFGTGSQALQNLSFGYFGEVGGLLAALKKVNRDKLLETDRDFASEELGDALWYLLAVAHVHGIKPATLGEVALGLLRTHYQEHSKALEGEVSFKNIDALIQAQVKRREDRDQLLSELAAAAGDLAAATGPQTDIRNSVATTQFLGNHLALLSRVAASFELNLNEVAAQNLAKIADRWPGDDPEYITPFDPVSDYPEYEQLPRNFTVEFDERANGGQKHVVQSIRGVFVGDRLTDNSVEEDGYRFHDVFHLAYVAHLGWSPVIRGLLKRKRKSMPHVDENQDGARAMIIEEGIATWIFNHAKIRGDNFAGVERGQLAFGLLKQLRQMVRGYEVDACPLWQWEYAILDGFRVFRELYEAKRGRVHVDMEAHTLVFEHMDSSQ